MLRCVDKILGPCFCRHSDPFAGIEIDRVEGLGQLGILGQGNFGLELDPFSKPFDMLSMP